MAKIFIFGVIDGSGWGDEVSAKSIADQLEKIKNEEEVTVYINSPGGNVFEGHAIYNLLAELKDRLTIKIIGQASSIASEISCAAPKGKTLIAANASMMIHYPWTFGMINEKYLDKLKKELVNVKESIFSSYANKTGMKSKQLEDIMSKEERYSAEDCVKMGFADEVWNPAEEEKEIIKESEDVNNKVFEQFRNVTMQNLAKLREPEALKELNIYIDKKLFIDFNTGGDMPKDTGGQGEVQNAPKPKEDMDLQAYINKLEAEKAVLESENKELKDKNVKITVDKSLENLVASGKILPKEQTDDGIILDLGGQKVTQSELLNLKRNEETVRLSEKVSVYDSIMNQLQNRKPMGGLNNQMPETNEAKKEKIGITDFKDFAKVVNDMEREWHTSTSAMQFVAQYAADNNMKTSEAADILIRKVEEGE